MVELNGCRVGGTERPGKNGDLLVAKMEKVFDAHAGSRRILWNDARDSCLRGVVADVNGGALPSGDRAQERIADRPDGDEFRGDPVAHRSRQRLGIHRVIELGMINCGDRVVAGHLIDQRLGEVIHQRVFQAEILVYQQAKITELWVHAHDSPQVVGHVAHLPADSKHPFAGFCTDSDAVIAIV